MIDNPPNAPMRGRSQPSRNEVLRSDRLTVVENPLSLALLARVRDRRTTSSGFGTFATELASLLLWEACRDLRVAETTVPNFADEPVRVHVLAERVAGVA